jgi:hypothetical protein
MSYEHAKALALMLAKNVDDHEKSFGPLYLIPRQKSPASEPPPEIRPSEQPAMAAKQRVRASESPSGREHSET